MESNFEESAPKEEPELPVTNDKPSVFEDERIKKLQTALLDQHMATAALDRSMRIRTSFLLVMVVCLTLVSMGLVAAMAVLHRI